MQLNSLLSSLLSPTSGGTQVSLPPPKPRGTDPADGTDKDGTSGVLAQISDAARQLFAQMKKDGISAESFDLHLDLRQLGLKVGATGSRSLEGHSLSVDLHIEAQQGKAKTDNGEVSFQQMDVSFTVEETWVKATQQDGHPPQAADQTDQTDSAKAPAKALTTSFIEDMKKLIALLDKSNGNDPNGAEGLGSLLAQIGKALEAMAKRLEAARSGVSQDQKQGDQAVQELQGFQLQEDVHVHAVHIQQVAVSDDSAPDSKPPTESKASTAA